MLLSYGLRVNVKIPLITANHTSYIFELLQSFTTTILIYKHFLIMFNYVVLLITSLFSKVNYCDG